MLQLTYISTVNPTTDRMAVEQILATSRIRNRAADVTGMLLFDGKRFLQLLEGPAPAVEATYARIHRDPRHRAVVRLDAATVDQRAFAGWDMACQWLDRSLVGPTLVEQVRAMVAGATPAIASHFTSFAELRG